MNELEWSRWWRWWWWWWWFDFNISMVNAEKCSAVAAVATSFCKINAFGLFHISRHFSSFIHCCFSLNYFRRYLFSFECFVILFYVIFVFFVVPHCKPLDTFRKRLGLWLCIWFDFHMCSGSRYLVVISPTATNTSYERFDLRVEVEYSGPQLINISTPLRFRYAGNPDIHEIGPRRIPNRFVYFVCVHDRHSSWRNRLRLVYTL